MIVSENISKQYFNILDIENLNKQKKSLHRKEVCNDFYSIFFIHEGEIRFSTNHLSISSEYKTLLFIPKDIKHQIIIKKNSKGSLIRFNDAFYNSNKHKLLLEDFLVFNQEKLSLIIRLSENDFNETLSIVHLFKLETKNTPTTSNTNIHQLLSYFLTKSKEKFIIQSEREDISNFNKANPVFTKFKEIIEENYSTNRIISNYANQLNVHPNCLNEISKLSSGLTASEIIHKRIISETKKLILSSENSFKEIAYKLGFEDPAYFSRYFKKHTGMTLSQYQNETRDMSK